MNVSAIIIIVSKVDFLSSNRLVIDSERIYGKGLKSKKVTTISDVTDECSESNRVHEIVVIAPAACDAGVDSDVENVPEDLENDTPYEAAGEYEIHESTNEEIDESEDSNDSSSDDEPPVRSKKKSFSQMEERV